jgi:hypothetical protein
LDGRARRGYGGDVQLDRWRLVYSRLNEAEAPAEEEGVYRQHLAWRWLDVLMRTPIAPRLYLRACTEERDVGPPCPLCEAHVDRSEDLVACTACLRVSHRTCLPDRSACPCGQPGG